MFSFYFSNNSNNHNNNTAFCGNLYKLKRNKSVISQWNRRFFSIEGKSLKWFYNEQLYMNYINSNNDKELVNGVLDLSKVTEITEFKNDNNAYW